MLKLKTVYNGTLQRLADSDRKVHFISRMESSQMFICSRAAGASSIKNTTLNKAGHTYSEHAAPPILEVMTSIEHIYSNTLHIPCAFFEDDSHLPSNPFLVFALGKRKSSFERTGLIEGEATPHQDETLEAASLTSNPACIELR